MVIIIFVDKKEFGVEMVLNLNCVGWNVGGLIKCDECGNEIFVIFVLIVDSLNGVFYFNVLLFDVFMNLIVEEFNLFLGGCVVIF